MDRLFTLIGLALILFSTAGMVNPRSDSRKHQNDLQRASDAANRFIKKFRETLDFGAAFDDIGVSNPVAKLRSSRFFEHINIEEKLVNGLNDDELNHIYKAFMNLHFLNALYYCGESNQAVPPEISSAINSSKFFSALQKEERTVPTITTRVALKDYIADMEKLAFLYKKHLKPDLFDSVSFKNCVARNRKSNGNEIAVRDGFEDFGVSKGVKVYIISRDLFTMYLAEENGEIKILTFGIGR